MAKKRQRKHDLQRDQLFTVLLFFCLISNLAQNTLIFYAFSTLFLYNILRDFLTKKS